MSVRKIIYAALSFIMPVFCNIQEAAGQEINGGQTVQSEENAAVPRQDSLLTSILTDKLEEYLDVLKTEPIDVQVREADFLIGSCNDSLVRQTVALKIFDHYLNSNIMGAEAVAVHLCDNWFIPGKIAMRSPEELMATRIYAEFNRSSLIGMKAPELALKDTTDADVILFPDNPANMGYENPDDCRTASGQDATEAHEQGKASGKRYSILYFYDTDCAKCRLETVMLRNTLENGNFPVDIYAIYTKDDRRKWMDWVHGNFNIDAPATTVRHLWDPDFSSGFLLKYGILETPAIFLISPDGTIAGRRLDSMALEQLLKMLLAPPAPAEYGSEKSAAFYGKLFGDLGPETKCGDVKALINHMAAKTLEDAHDTLLFKQMTGDLLYWLSGKRGETAKCGTDYLIHSQILPRHDIWNTSDDSLKVVQFAEVMQELLERAQTGSRMPEIKVHAILKSSKGERYGQYRLDRLHHYRTIFIFHTEGCNICKAELAAADSLLESGTKESRSTRVLLIDMDEIFSSWPETAEALFNAFDLTALPYITETDRNGIIIRKYMTLAESGESTTEPHPALKNLSDEIQH